MKRRGVVSKVFPLSRIICLCAVMALCMLQGCIGVPNPAGPVMAAAETEFREVTAEPVLNSIGREPVAIVLKYIASSIEEKAGLKIAGIIQDGSLPAQVIAMPKKSEGIVAIWVTELLITPSPDGRITEAQLSLSLSAFDGSGQAVYMRTVTSREGGEGDLISEASLDHLLERITVNALTQYTQDPALRAIILKFRFAAMRNIF